MSKINDTEVAKPLDFAFEESEIEELKRHHAELDKLIERFRSKLGTIDKLNATQQLVKAENIHIPQQGYMSESRMKLDDFSDKVNVDFDNLLRDHKRLLMLATNVCHGCSSQTMNGVLECECLRERNENNSPIHLFQGVRLCETCIKDGTMASADAKVCFVCTAVGCTQDSGRGCGTTFSSERPDLLGDSSQPIKSMCARCVDKYVVEFSLHARDLSSETFQLARHREVHKHSLAKDHGGALAVLDDDCLDTVFGYFNAATMCRFSQTNYTNCKLMDSIAKAFVEKTFSQELILYVRELNYYTVMQKLYRIEYETASLFGFDFVDDMDGAATFSRCENKASFTKFYDPIKHMAASEGPFVCSNFLLGNSTFLEGHATASAICGNLPLTCGEEHFLIVILQGMKGVGPFTFGLVASECCPKALASSPEDNFCANFKLSVPDIDCTESKVVLGIKFDSSANQLTHIYLCGESHDGYDVNLGFNPNASDWNVAEDTVDFANTSTATLFWALQFSCTEDLHLPYLVGVRDATKDEFEQLQQRILSYPE